MDKLTQSLLRLFDTHRIIFWYDENQEMTEQVAKLSLPGIDIVSVANNEFSLKYRVLRLQPKTSFLLYLPYAQPAPEQNWLLDVQLAGYVFRTDMQAQYMQELGLAYPYHDFVSHHIEFFKSARRREKLVKLGIIPGETEAGLRHRMLAVVFGQDSPSLSDMLLAYAQAVATNTHERLGQELTRYNLADTFWQQVKNRFGYVSATPGTYEFLLALFQTDAPFLPSPLRTDARILMDRWRVNRRHQVSFQTLSTRIGNDLNLPTLLPRTTLDALLDDDLFELVEQRIVGELARLVANGTTTTEQIESVQKQRRNKYWYEKHRHFYDMLLHAVWLQTLVTAWADEPFESLTDGPERYTTRLYRVDNHYRHVLYAYRQTGQHHTLEEVMARINAVYTNQWLLPIGNHWQRIVDQTPDWTFGPLQTQRNFFRYQVEPQLSKGRTFVIISDALRYEWGRDLTDRMQAENRYVAELSYMVTGVPSYTQLGMAALLPQTQLSIQPGTDAVLADGMPTQGTDNRSAVLARQQGIAIKAEHFLALNANKEGREWVKPYQVIYIYHNVIDRIGDVLATEQQVVDESERVLDTIQEIIRKVTNMNGVHIWVTADHGFLYQQQPVADTDFLDAPVSGTVWKQGRRFVLGQDLSAGAGFRRFEARQVGLTGDAVVMLPKAGQRLRLSGAGSRFVHGGASLQETVVPLLKITKKKINTLQPVSVDIIRSSERITTNLVAVSFWQQEAVGDGLLPRQLRVSFVAEDGTQLSDQFAAVFDSTEPSERLRETKHRFQLTQKAGSLYNNQTIYLRLEEPIDGTNQWKSYRTFNYLLTISFTNDFD